MMMIWVGLLVLLLVGGAVAVAVLGGLGIAFGKGTGTQWLVGQRQPAAIGVLEERLARGEIGADEYESIRALLER